MRPAQAAEHLGEEIRSHLELETARRKFGSTAAVIEDTRQFWGFRWWDNLASDLRYAFRTFRKDRGFVLTSVAILALGLGITSACFALLDAVLLRPLPYADPDRLLMLWSVNEARGITIEQARKSSQSRNAA